MIVLASRSEKDLGEELDVNNLPLIAPDDVDLQDRYDQGGSEDSGDDNGVHNLIPLLIHSARNHYYQVLPPVLHYRLRPFRVLLAEP